MEVEFGMAGDSLEIELMAVTSLNAAAAEATAALAGCGIPPLENGDRLSRVEFERRYQAMPHVKKAELIEGVVYLPSPVRHRAHSSPHGSVVGWVFNYRAHTPGVELGDNGTVRLDDINEPQPDAMLFIPKKLGGQTEISEDDYVEGAPELVVEVASSSASYDLGAKLTACQRNGVRESVVWRASEGRVDWFLLRNDQVEALMPEDDGILRSRVFPGLWLDPAALLRDDSMALLDALSRGVQSEEHAAFVARLSQARVG
jgi:Uma2 family endonuclease